MASAMAGPWVKRPNYFLVIFLLEGAIRHGRYGST